VTVISYLVLLYVGCHNWWCTYSGWLSKNLCVWSFSAELYYWWWSM